MGAAGVGVFENDQARDYADSVLERLRADLAASLQAGDDATALAALQLLSAVVAVSPGCPPDQATVMRWREQFCAVIATGGWVDPTARLAEVDAVVARLAEQAGWQVPVPAVGLRDRDLPELFVGVPGLRGLGQGKLHLTLATLQHGRIWSQCQRCSADAATALPLPIGTRLTRKQTCGWCWNLARQAGDLVAHLHQPSGVCS